ncbi:MAG: hypothetical protein DI631_13965, partial [Acinetobacter johnsonii]
MQCSIYKSSKKDEMYLYIACPTEADQAAEDFSPLNVLPEA